MGTNAIPQGRVPPGVPTGGQFAGKVNAESTVTLDEPSTIDGTPGAVLDRAPVGDPTVWETIRERRGLLASEGYVPPVALNAILDPNSTAHRTEWWDQEFVSGEYGHQAGDYPQMPDDFTPSMTTGRSLEGNRRTHRMAYKGAGVVLRMPSATAIKRYAAQGVTTFDVPVSAQHPGGSIAGWVRVTKGADGSWATRGLGFSPEDSAYVAEAAQCVLEARRPSRALADAGDLLERRKSRAAQIGVKADVTVNSTWISRLGYDKSSSTMIMTTAGRKYGYSVPASVFRQVVEDPNPGKVYNFAVKGQAARVEVAECPKCQRFTSGGVRHRCPPKEGRRRATSDVNRLHQQSAVRPRR